MSHWRDCLDPDGPDGAYLPWKKVEPRVGISRTTAWRLQRCGDFPKAYVVSPGRVAYKESEVEAWKASRAHRSATAIGLKPRPGTRAAPPMTDAAPTAVPVEPTKPPNPTPPTLGPAHALSRPSTPARARRSTPAPDQMRLDF